jgi:hypothetical protein
MRILITALVLTALPVLATSSSPNGSLSHPRREHVSRSEKEILFRNAGVPKSQRKYYVVDHTIPVKLGGNNELSNLQLQTRPEAKAKNRIEKYILKKVRKGEITVEEAQHASLDWKHVRLK